VAVQAVEIEVGTTQHSESEYVGCAAPLVSAGQAASIYAAQIYASSVKDVTSLTLGHSGTNLGVEFSAVAYDQGWGNYCSGYRLYYTAPGTTTTRIIGGFGYGDTALRTSRSTRKTYTKSIDGVFEAGGTLTVKTYTPWPGCAITTSSNQLEVDVCASKSSGTVTDDPHFVGFDGSHYDFQGEPGQVFNLITDTGFQVNAKFVESATDGQTYMGELGFKLKDHTVKVDRSSVAIDGSVVSDGVVELTTLSEEPAGTVRVANGVAVVHAAGFSVEVEAVTAAGGFVYLNIKTSAVSSGLHHPHGLLGQTSQYMLRAEEPHAVNVPHSNKNSKGFIEGSPTDYLVVDGIYGTNFAFNRFGSKAAKRDFAVPERRASGRASFLGRPHLS
jgi:hypothetical protein